MSNGAAQPQGHPAGLRPNHDAARPINPAGANPQAAPPPRQRMPSAEAMSKPMEDRQRCVENICACPGMCLDSALNALPQCKEQPSILDCSWKAVGPESLMVPLRRMIILLHGFGVVHNELIL